jgi:signal transduction histidine kinase
MGVAHEISTPLAVILGRAEQLLARAVDERSAQQLRSIVEQSERISTVMRGLLNMARGHAPSSSSVAPRALVQDAVALVEHRFDKAGVLLAVEVENALPCVRGEPRLLEHAIVNLLLNACDASASGQLVTVSVSASTGQVTFEVDDVGTGMSADALARATEPFFTTKSEQEGTGLGLAIVHEIVHAHRGSILLSPRVGGGTRARLVLPVDVAQPE